MNAVLKLVPQTRICKTCNQAKAIGEFHVHGGYVLHKCIDCHRAYKRNQNKKYSENSEYREKRSEQKKTYLAANPDKRRGIKDRPDKLKRLYGVTYEHVVNVLNEQHGLCANRACGKEISLEVVGAKSNRAVIDHNHKTGKFRALLCIPCNSLLGSVETKKNVLLGLIEYETKHNSKQGE